MTGGATAEFVKRWWPSMLTGAAVLWLTLASSPTPDIEIPSFLGEYADKVVHAIMFGGLTGAIIFDRMRQSRPVRRPSVRFMIFLIISVSLFAASDEMAQEGMGIGRTGDVYDFLSDLCGILLAALTAPPVVRMVLPRR